MKLFLRPSFAIATAAALCAFAANDRHGHETPRAVQSPAGVMNHIGQARFASAATGRETMAHGSWDALMNAHWQ